MKKFASIIIAICIAVSCFAQTSSDAAQGKKYFEQEYYAKALPLLKKAAKAGDLDAKVMLADMTFFGNEIEMDRIGAYEMLDECIAQGSAYAMERKGFYLIVEGKKKEGLDMFKQAAAAGNADAAIYVMDCLRNGDADAEICPEEAAKYCKLAAEAGSMEGEAFLGVYTYRGESGVEKNEAEGIKLIESAYAKSERNSFEKNCFDAAKILADYYSTNGQADKAASITAALKKYHPEKM